MNATRIEAVQCARCGEKTILAKAEAISQQYKLTANSKVGNKFKRVPTADRIRQILGCRVSRLTAFSIKSLWQAIAPHLSLALLLLHKCSDKELEHAAIAIEQELNFRNHLIGVDKSLNW